jgi:hypothetical protein
MNMTDLYCWGYACSKSFLHSQQRRPVIVVTWISVRRCGPSVDRAFTNTQSLAFVSTPTSPISSPHTHKTSDYRRLSPRTSIQHTATRTSCHTHPHFPRHDHAPSRPTYPARPNLLRQQHITTGISGQKCPQAPHQQQAPSWTSYQECPLLPDSHTDLLQPKRAVHS